MASDNKRKNMAVNTIYTMGGALLMNGVLQLIIYPLLNRFMGSSQLGILLYIMGLAAILCPSVGQALNTSRLVVRRNSQVSNGDYCVLLLLFGGVGCLASLAIARDSMESVGAVILTAVLLMATIFRYYGDVEYRLNLDYKKYFIYYAVLSVGYIAGFGLYFLTGNWFLVFLSGEILALAYLAATGSVFRGFFARSSFFGTAFHKGWILVLSYLITNLTLNIDRLVLKHFISDLAVTEYYVTSLIGKTLVLLVAPINTILISYLTKKKENLTRKQFLSLTGAGVCVSLVFWGAAQIGTPIFIKLFYPLLYESVKPMVAIVNISQILGLLSAYLFIIVLTFTKENWQLILQVFHLAVMVLLVALFMRKNGLMGFSVAVLSANAIRVGAVVLLGLVKVKNRPVPGAEI